MVREYGKKRLEGRDVDHKKMLKDGGTNARGNLRILSEYENRGWRRRE